MSDDLMQTITNYVDEGYEVTFRRLKSSKPSSTIVVRLSRQFTPDVDSRITCEKLVRSGRSSGVLLAHVVNHTLVYMYALIQKEIRWHLTR